MEHGSGTCYSFRTDGAVDNNGDINRKLMMNFDAACLHGASSKRLTNETLKEALGLRPLLGAMATPAPLWKRIYARWSRHFLF